MKRLAILLPAALFALPAPAQDAPRPAPRCAPATDMRSTLLEAFGEERRFVGLIESKGVLELYSGPDSWSLTLTRPDGTACLVAAGYAHFLIPPGEPA